MIGIATFVLFILYEDGIVSGVYPLCLGLISLVAYLLIHFHKYNILEEFVCKKFFHRTAITEEYTKSYRKWKLQAELDNLVRNISSEPIGYKVIDISYQAIINKEQLFCKMMLKDSHGNLKESVFSYELRKINKNYHISCPVLDMESVELLLPSDQKGNLLSTNRTEEKKNKRGER